MRRTVRSHFLFGMIQIAVLLSIRIAVHAQAVPAPSPAPGPSLEKQFFKNILSDQKAIWTAPLHVERSDSKWMIPSGIGLMALFTTDRITGDEISEFDRQAKAGKIISFPGSTYGVGTIAATFYLLGRKKHDERARETGILSAEATIDSLIVSSGLKGISQRGRPQTGRERSEFFDGGNSFPSGHSIQAWSVATIIANEYHDHRAVQFAAYGLASAISMARFTAGKHYLSDVLVGSALGYGIGQYVYHAHHRAQSSPGDQSEDLEETHHLSIVPQYNSRAREYGATLTWRF